MSLAAGHRVGAYEILGRLGAGGMGEVYQARDTRLGRLVAIKVISRDLTADPTAVARLAREARLTSSLNHPNIVTVHDVGEHEGQPFIVMEYVAGRLLHDLLASGKLKPARAVDIAHQIADGLATAHAAGVVHRDLKPRNIMLTDAGRAKIVDFGLSKVPIPVAGADDATVLAADLTAPHVIPGTVGYMSPELVNGEPVDFRADQFAFGAIVYEMITGRRAFKRDTRVQTMAAIVESEPEAIAEISPDAPDELIRIVERCLAKQPSHRYASTQDLARDLRDLHVGTVSSRSGTTIRRPKPRTRRRWVTAAVAVLILGITAAFLLTDRSTALNDARALLDRYDKVENVNHAIALLEEPAVAERQDGPVRRTLLAEAYWRRYEHTRDRALIDRAAESAGASLKLDAAYAPTHVVLAMVNNGQSRWDGAAGEARQAIALAPDHSRAWRELGRAYQGQQKMDDARQAYLEAVKFGPSDWTAHNFLGAFYYATNQLDLAAASFQRVLDVAPDNIRGYNNLGSVSLRLERFDRAAEMYERSLSLERNATAFANLGRAYYEQGQYADAARSYEGAVSLPGPTLQHWSNLGAASYWAPGLRDRARVAYETAIKLGGQAREDKPKDPAVLAAIADAHAMLAKLTDSAASAGHAAEARTLIAAIEVLKPQGADVLFTVASTHEELGDRITALEWLARAVTAGYPLKSVERSPFLTDLRKDPGYLNQFQKARLP